MKTLDQPADIRTQIARSAAVGLRRFADRIAASPVVIGFDGFVDSIIEVVDQRHDAEHYEPMQTIDQLGGRIAAAAGQSSNYELVVKLVKLGGNGPIMANATAAIGLPTVYVGALGHPAIHPAFAELNSRARCLSFCEPGYTDALEFRDGKIMLGKHGTLKDASAQRLRSTIGDEVMRDVIGSCRLLGMVNWTMLTRMGEIWRYLIAEVLPGLREPASGRRMIFIDLADPEKRTRADLKRALGTATEFQKFADVVLGYNLKEAVQVAQVLGIPVGDEPEREIEKLAIAIRQALAVHCVVIHPRGGAAASVRVNGHAHSASFAGPLVKNPKLSTGAGDNFNAGFCLGLLADLPVEQALCVGTATSGYYVRNAASPTLAALADFCDHLPAPE